MDMQRKRHRSLKNGDPSPQTHTEIHDGEDCSKAIWFPGCPRGPGMDWYRIDIDVFSLREQMEIRRSRNQSARIIDMDIDMDMDPSLIQKGLVIHRDSFLDVPDACCRYLAVGRFLCCIGGFQPEPASNQVRARAEMRIPSNIVFCLDTTQSDLGWNRCPIQTSRILPYMTAMDSMVYIFGTATGEAIALDHFAEVFDPSKKESYLLPPYPTDADTHPTAIIPLPHLSKIVLCFSSDSIVYFDVKHRKWDVQINQRIFPKVTRPFGSTHAVVGDTVYWFSTLYNFVAYDFTTKETYFTQDFCLHSSELASLDPERVSPTLLHLSNNLFCLVWIDSPYFENDRTNYNVIKCTKLSISKCLDKKTLSVSPAYTQSYLVNTSLGFISAVLTRN